MIAGALVALLLLASPQSDQARAQTTPETVDYAEGRTDAVATFTATDPDGTRVVWSLDGTDKDVFAINTGVLTFLKSPDFEAPEDVAGGTTAAEDNIYEVTVKATDETMKVGTKVVIVTVTNVDEAGTVALSARRPQSATAYTAGVSDPDGDVTNAQWQWAKSGSRNGSYANIANAETATYSPSDADVGAYLRATVTYTDPEDSGKPAAATSEFSVQRVRGSNSAPEFAADQDPVTDGAQADAARAVAENTMAGQPVGSPVTATDDDGDTLTYTLGGTDAASFDIDWGTGRILTKVALDHETKDEYTVTVRATDPAGIPGATNAVEANSDQITVVITITDVNEAPVVTGNAEALFEEVDGNIGTALSVYAAADPDAGAPTPTWSVSGVDGAKFTAVGGDLTFIAMPDFEMPTDANRDNVYEVTVQASEGKLIGVKAVKVTVQNQDEPGVVTLSSAQPRAGIAVTATLTDPDGSISRLTWQWSKGGLDIPGATSDTYVPTTADVTAILVATASYTDGHSSGKTREGTAANAVAADTRNRAPVFNDQDPITAGVQNDTATRNVEENTEANDADDAVDDADEVADDNVGSPVMASDPDPNEDPLIYTLSGADAARFRVRDNGQIEVGAGTDLDAETKTTYSVTVTATDSFSASDSIDVTITVTPLDEAPEVTGNDEINYAENGTGSVATYRATDPERASIRWSLDGTDKDVFAVTSGVLTFLNSPDFETRMDVAGTGQSTAAAMDNIYEVTVKATDETMNVGTKQVLVTVTNVEEPGKVTLSARGPQSAIAFTAEPSDPDGLVTNARWQWAKSGSRNGSYANIANAETATYTPSDADLGAYLRATATYTDPEDSGKTAVERSEFAVQAVRGDNKAPEFAADQDPVMPGDQANAEREVAENSQAGQPVGSQVTATDDDGDTLTYTLVGGGDADSFDIDWGTGQILTKGPLDHETKDRYTVTVRATDPAGIPAADPRVEANSDEVEVVITITDVNEAPEVTGEDEVTFNEVSGDITVALDTYSANDRDDNPPTPTWSVAGVDGAKFTAVDGQLKFKLKPDFEMPTDADRDNVYEVTVQASDGRLIGMKAVKVTVENENEDGVVTLSSPRPRVGIAVTATLTDPDGSISRLTWQWSNGDVIDGATSDTYVPTTLDVQDTLVVTASYTDGHDPNKTAVGTAANPVEADTRNKAPVFDDQDPITDGLQNDTATRNVDENTKANAPDDVVADAADVDVDNVGSPVTAMDPDPNADPLIYTLSGADAAKFRVRDNGQIEVGAGTELDAETKTTYRVTVTATDSFGASDSIDVTITVVDIDEAPVLFNKALVVVGDVRVDYPEDRNDPVGTYQVVGPDAARARWTVLGADLRRFTISGGVLRFRSSPDYEAPADADTNNVYVVTVRAAYGSLQDERIVTVSVINVDEDGSVTLSPSTARAGVEITATLTDIDVVTAGTVSWRWARSTDGATNWVDIGTATLNTYTPVQADADNYLRATASYTDGHGPGKSEDAVSTNAVVVIENTPPEFPASETGARSVSENAAAGTNIGDPVAAEDTRGDTLTYTLGGTDAASFDIVAATGQLQTKAALDAATKATYTVTVTATDTAGASAEITVTITVTVTTSTLGPLGDRYDANDNGVIERDEVITAIRHYFDDRIDRLEVIAIIRLYFTT